jgi:hypothetical protein
LYAQRVIASMESFEACKFSIAHSDVLIKLFARTHPPEEEVEIIRHRVFVRNLVAYLRKQMIEDRSFGSKLEHSCYDWHLDLIPVYNSGHLSTYYPEHFPAPPATVTPSMLTRLYYLMWTQPSSILMSSFAINLRELTLVQSSIWSLKDSPSETIDGLNQRFEHVAYRRHTSTGPVLFATTYGPSCLSCSGCGFSFVPEGWDLDSCPVEWLDSIRLNRNSHFNEVFRDGGRWTSSNYHLAIRHVLYYQYRTARVYQESMLVDVLKRLITTDSGNHYVPELLTDLRAIIESYLALRRAGAPESDRNDYMTKLLTELKRI